MDKTLDRLDLVVPENIVASVLVALADDESRAEFVEGLGKHLHRVSVDSSPQARTDLLRFLRRWVVSLTLSASPEWQASAEAADRQIADRSFTEGVDSAGLRALLNAR